MEFHQPNASAIVGALETLLDVGAVDRGEAGEGNLDPMFHGRTLNMVKKFTTRLRYRPCQEESAAQPGVLPPTRKP